MSAINEWFGIYNMIFRYIKNRYGEGELSTYVRDTAQKAYACISEGFREKGIDAVLEYYSVNFKKDGGTAETIKTADYIEFNIKQCPAYKYMQNSENPYDRPERYYCSCCSDINRTLLENAGYELKIDDCDCEGSCRWTIIKSQPAL
jgi:hypothetical protein